MIKWNNKPSAVVMTQNIDSMSEYFCRSLPDLIPFAASPNPDDNWSFDFLYCFTHVYVPFHNIIFSFAFL